MIANVGSKWDGGKLVFFAKATGNEIVTFDPTNETLSIGGVAFGRAANQAASTASDAAGAVTDLNTLLTNLKAAGLMVDDAE